LPDGKTRQPEKLVVKTDLLRLMRPAGRGIFVMSIKIMVMKKADLNLLKGRLLQLYWGTFQILTIIYR